MKVCHFMDIQLYGESHAYQIAKQIATKYT